jgi:hypothetical protein
MMTYLLTGVIWSTAFVSSPSDPSWPRPTRRLPGRSPSASARRI